MKNNPSSKETENDCIFCKFARKEIDRASPYEDENIYTMLDINPAGTLIGHTLVIPKKHYKTIDQVDDKSLCEIIKAIKMLTPAVIKVAGAQGANIIQNNGTAAGQAINHIHFHIIPRKFNDGIWFDEKRRKPAPMELIQTAKAIKEELKKL